MGIHTQLVQPPPAALQGRSAFRTIRHRCLCLDKGSSGNSLFLCPLADHPRPHMCFTSSCLFPRLLVRTSPSSHSHRTHSHGQASHDAVLTPACGWHGALLLSCIKRVGSPAKANMASPGDNSGRVWSSAQVSLGGSLAVSQIFTRLHNRAWKTCLKLIPNVDFGRTSTVREA